MSRVLRICVATLAGVFGLGLVVAGASASSTATGGDDVAYAKRDDDVREVAAVDDDDDDGDTATRSRNTGTDTRSRSRDHTRSNHTAVSRDRDLSRGDVTRDGTRDGGSRHRDLKSNLTNDPTRNDTR